MELTLCNASGKQCEDHLPTIWSIMLRNTVKIHIFQFVGAQAGFAAKREVNTHRFSRISAGISYFYWEKLCCYLYVVKSHWVRGPMDEYDTCPYLSDHWKISKLLINNNIRELGKFIGNSADSTWISVKSAVFVCAISGSSLTSQKTSQFCSSVVCVPN